MSRYNCQACEDPEQGSPFIEKETHRAVGNRPKYAHLCRKHFERLTDEQKRDYLSVPPPSDDDGYCSCGERYDAGRCRH